MVSEWRTVRLGEVLSYVVDNRGKTPPVCETEAHELIEINALVGSIKTPNFSVIKKFVSDEIFNTWFRKGHPKVGDVLFSTVGSIAEIAYIKEEKGCIAQNLVALRPDTSFIIGEFLFYTLKNPMFKSELMSLDISSVQPSIKVPHLLNTKFQLPILVEQRAIASLLGALDDKIELNRQMNETLETMARLFFKDWFIDYGPTRAKAEGRQPYLAPEFWSLFPDTLDDDDKPKGWDVSTIGQEVRVVGGSTPSTKEPAYWDGELCWATPKDLSSLKAPVLFNTERRITQAGISQTGSGLLPTGTVLLSSRAPIGYLVISQVETAVNQGFIAMICEGRLTNVFIWLWTQANMEAIHQKANGSTFQEISKANFRPIPVIVADSPILRAFDEITQPLYKQIVANERETITLTATRDLLLPKLMSGEIRLCEAEKLVEQVA